MKTTSTVLLLFFELCTVRVSAQDFETLRPFQAQDSSFVVALPSLHIQLTYPWIDSTSSSPRLYRSCGVISLLIASSNENSVVVEFGTRRAISAYADSFKASPARKDPGDEEFPPETPEEFDHWRDIIGRGTEGDSFDRYLSSAGQRYGIRTYFTELTDYATDVTTYLDTVQFRFRVFTRGEKWSRRVKEFVFRELGLRFTDESRDLARKLVLLRLRQDALRIFNRIRLDRL